MFLTDLSDPVLTHFLIEPFVPKVDNAIHQINYHPPDSTILVSLAHICEVVIYLVNSAIQLLNN